VSSPQEFKLSSGWLGETTPRACIIGLGLIGGSWAGALHRLGWEVLAVDLNQDSLTKAKAKGWILEGLEAIPPTIDADLIILALPVDRMDLIVDKIISAVNPGTVVTDVASIKNTLHFKSHELAARGACFIGGHPMTGSEKSGFDSARVDLFNNFPYVLISDSECPPIALQALADLVRQTGAKVVMRDAVTHDLDVAYVSHLPHLIAVALTLCTEKNNGDHTTLELAGRSFREMTRVAESPPEMWQEILIRNRTAVLKALDSFLKELNVLRENVLLEDRESIAASFRRASELRIFLKKDGG